MMRAGDSRKQARCWQRCPYIWILTGALTGSDRFRSKRMGPWRRRVIRADQTTIWPWSAPAQYLIFSAWTFSMTTPGVSMP